MSEQKNIGPVFESSPGWGGKTKAWLSKYFYKVILPVIIIVLVGYGIASRNGGNVNEDISPLESNNFEDAQALVSQTIGSGEGRIHVARRAIAWFLSENSDISLTAGQKVYLETVLAQNINKDLFKTGETVTFSDQEILNEIENARNLKPSQLDKWEAYARTAGVK
jgi:hypothetical protein